jgi:hypothetical protein
MSGEIVQAGIQTIAKVELDMQISTAKAYPRDVKKFIKEAIMLATIDQETAESCIYALPRGKDNGKQTYLKGESVRLAEICLGAWGNIHAATRIKEKEPGAKVITAEALVWDLEKNVQVRTETQRSIVSRSGQVFTQDMQVVTGNAAASIALRNGIFKVIPKAFVKQVYNAAVNFSIGDQTKLTQKVHALFERFKKLGIQPEKILGYFNKKSADEITAEEVEEMIGIGTAIKENNLKIDQAFEFDQGNANSDDLNNEFDDKFKKDKQKEIDQEFLKELGDAE